MKKLIVPILTLLFLGCDKEESVKPNTDANAAVEALTEFTVANKVFQDVGNNSADAVLSAESSTNTSKSNNTKANEPVITVSPLDFTTFPKTITIDYQSGVLCKDGITRKGKIIVVSTDWYGKKDSEHTATFENYYHNEFKVQGTHYVKNLGKNQDDNLEYSVTIENGKITNATGATINYTEQSTRTWVAGSDTPLNIWDDEYLLDGTQAGVSSKGIEYALTVVDPLHFVLLPRSIESGILNVSVGNINDIELNYTNKTLTILGKTYPFIEE
ncbi:hypothetical protein KO566_10980 [Flavobacteriaceae bacterium XHP0103]|uniref:hypothetical protein n=1 Tax=Marixanthotalea marina TaxID=2844359 RepID=UPI002989DCD0|nr:hypothetical protein [Marixanthotalea marina]MBU3822588.1 hypothetical protein [Marixanthotalea marina]